MEVKEQSKLQFKGLSILSFAYTCYRHYEGQSKIEIDIKPKVFYPSDNTKQFRIIMELSLKASEDFDMSLLGVGDFECPEELTDLTKKRFVHTNAPAIVFPYIRAFITTFSANTASFKSPIVLPPHFFQGEIEVMPKID